MEIVKCSVENCRYKSSTEFGICKFHLNHRIKREEKEKLLEIHPHIKNIKPKRDLNEYQLVDNFNNQNI